METSVWFFLFVVDFVSLNSWMMCAEGRVEVFPPYQPLYVEEGSEMTLLCNSSRTVPLQWTEKTPATSWADLDINVTVGSPYVTRYLVEKPSGYCESVLFKKNMALHDRGLYTCHDQDKTNSFNVWATVITIYADNIIATKDTEELTLLCQISGFDSNRPEIGYTWLHEDSVVATDDEHMTTVVDPNRGRLKLLINKPSAADSGTYNCSFILGTDQGPLVFSRLVELNASALSHASRTVHYSDFTFIMAVILLRMS